MAQENIIYKSIYNFIYNFSDYNDIRNNEEKLITIINKKSFNLKNNIKKLVKNKIIYDEMLILIENKNKEIEELKKQLQK